MQGTLEGHAKGLDLPFRGFEKGAPRPLSYFPSLYLILSNQLNGNNVSEFGRFCGGEELTGGAKRVLS
jgi:hypothetical protein